jgi:aminoglycoside phosphotransferase (APT) family kinase protein
MNVIRGVELAYAWHAMCQDTKDWAIVQLKDYIAQLRALDPPSTDGAVTSVIGGPLRDGSRVGLKQFGPFRNHDDFHQFLRAGSTVDSFGAFQDTAKVLISHGQQYATKFTHGDLAPRNIMMKEDGTITAIVDWDSAGWFPEYWEYTKANFTSQAPESERLRADMMSNFRRQAALWIYVDLDQFIRVYLNRSNVF